MFYKKIFLAIFSLFFLILISLAFFVQAEHSWGFYHWARTANPFTLKLGDNMTSIWKPYLLAVSNDWNDSSVLNTSITSGQGGPNCRPTSGRVEVCNKKYGNNGWLGIAQIWISGNHITQAVAKMNDTYFNTTKYNTTAWRQFVLCQEIGHIFGLDHQDENFNNPNLGSCMDYTNNPARNDGAGDNLHPNKHDFEQLESIYSHFDSIATVKSFDKSNRGKEVEIDLNNPLEWGKQVKKDAKNQTSLFEKELGKDKKLFTFVVWVQ